MKRLHPSGYAAVILFFLSLHQAEPLLAEDQSKKEDEPTRLSEVVVDSTALDSPLFESVQPVSVLAGEELAQRASATLGETLSKQAGIASTSFGPGSSRPVIRGLGGDRIRILENGIGTQDVSNTSPDHAVAVEPLLAESIEILRGPAALLYGTSGIGGVVNVLDSRIPTELPAGPAAGLAELRGGTNSLERAAVGKVSSSLGPLALHLDGSFRKTDDIHIPGFARTPALRNSAPLDYPEPRGRLPFSATDTNSSALGVSYILGNGYFGVSASDFNSMYGVPNGEENMAIDAERRRFDLRTQLAEPVPGVRQMEFKLGVVDYHHTELEDGEAGTKFDNQGVETRYELRHQPIWGFEGLAGLQYQYSDFVAVGEEAFLPQTYNNVFSGFLFEELSLSDSVKLQGGLRFDYHSLETNGFTGGGVALRGPVSRHDTTVSASTGLIWVLSESYAVATSVAYTERPPSGQEALSNGRHLATGSFEVGDPTLPLERSLGVDLTLRRQVGRLTGSIGAFYNHFENYIDLLRTGETIENLPEYRFVSETANFFGVESELAFHLLGPLEPGVTSDDFAVFFQPDWIWAENADSGAAIPRTTPFRLLTGLSYSVQPMRARLELQQVFRQSRNHESETATDGYTMLNLTFAREVKFDQRAFEFFVRGSNLLNVKARNHVSFLKDVAPLPGTDVVAGLKVRF